MNRLGLLLVAAAVVMAGGCIFSSDETPPAPDNAWKPELYVTPDSVYAWFPCEWPDTVTWTWNRSPEHTWEYVLDASLRIRNVNAHIAFAYEGDGGAPRSGSLSQLIEEGSGFFWTEDRSTGEYIYPPRPFGSAYYRDGGVVVTTWLGPLIYGQVPPRSHCWVTTFTRRGAFGYRSVQRNARFQHDSRQLEARRVEGPLSQDDYAVLDRVLRSYLPNSWPATVVVSTTIHGPGAFFADGIDLLQPDCDTRAAFDVVQAKELDVGALSQLGYTMVARGEVVPGDVLYLSVTGAGYNHRGDQALVYGTYDCGMLCAEGVMFLLEKIEGYWVIRQALQLWIS